MSSPTAAAQRRLLKEVQLCEKWQHPNIKVRPAPDGNMREMHFVIHNLASNTPYVGGFYHGKLVLPSEYPWHPPAIQMLTPTGRFEINQDICTSASNWHQENWNPDWNVMTILIGFLSLFLDDEDRGVGHVHPLSTSDAARRKLAKDSTAINSQNSIFIQLFPEFKAPDSPPSTSCPTQDHTCDVDASFKDEQLCLAPDMEASRARNQVESVCVADDEFKDTGDVAVGNPPSASSRNEARNEDNVDDEEDAQLLCRFCLEGEEHEPLIEAPCACRGSMGGLHASCLHKWIRRSGNLSCTTCKQKYTGATFNLDGLDSLSESMAMLVSAHAGTQIVLICGFLGIGLLNHSVNIGFDVPSLCLYFSAIVLGRLAGYCLTWQSFWRRRTPIPEGVDVPMLPVAIVRILSARLFKEGRFFHPCRVHHARAVRPDIGFQCMLGCGALFTSMVTFFNATGEGLMALISIWIFSACAAHVARYRCLQHAHEQRAEENACIDTMMALSAAYSGSFWSILIAIVSTLAILDESITLVLNCKVLIMCILAMGSGLYVGHKLTHDPRRQLEAEAPLLIGGAEAVASHVVRRLQVARAVRSQVVRSFRLEISFGCGCVCVFVLSLFYFWTRSLDLCFVALCSWQLCVNCAGRVVMRVLHIQWYIHMFVPS